MVLLAGLVLVLGPGGVFACLASDDAGTRAVQSPLALEVDFVSAGDADWDMEGSEKGSWYGYSVASAGNVDGRWGDDILVGAPKDSTLEGGGAAYLYLSEGGGLSTTDAWSRTEGDWGALFGWSVAGAGDVNNDGNDDAIVGAPDHKARLWVNDGYKDVQAGRVFLYQGVPGVGLSIDYSWSYTGTVQWGEFGYAVAGAGNLNNDEFDDIAVGARYYTDPDNPQDKEGALYVFYGSSAGPSDEPDWYITSNQAGAWLGASVSAAGDVNDDGCDDLIVGAPRYVNPETGLHEGAVFLFLGRATGAPSSVADAAWRAYGWQDGARFGESVAAAGDVNGDGHPDVVVSTPSYDRPSDGVEAGAAFAYCGNGSTFGSDPCWTAYGAQPAGSFGASAGGAGDVNGDGFDDVIIGAPTYAPDPDTGLEGAAFVYFGSDGGLLPWAGWKVGGNRSRTDLGASVGSAGDVDGDSFDSIIIGAPQYFVSTDPYGAAFVFHGPLEPGDLYRAYLPLIMSE